MRAVAMTNWAEPAPNTSRRIDHNRSKENSRPMRKRRKRTPSSANGSTLSGPEKVIGIQPWREFDEMAEAAGPSRTPATRKPGTMPIRSQPNSGTTTPAVASTINRSLSQLPSNMGLWISHDDPET